MCQSLSISQLAYFRRFRAATLSWRMMKNDVGRVGLDQRSCSTSSPASIGMGDCFWAGKLSHYVISHPGQLSLVIPLWVGAMSTGDGYSQGRKQRVLRSSSPCDQDCWYIELVG